MYRTQRPYPVDQLEDRATLQDDKGLDAFDLAGADAA